MGFIGFLVLFHYKNTILYSFIDVLLFCYSSNLLMVFNAFLIIFDIRNITQWAYSFNGTPVIKLQPMIPQFWNTFSL